MHIAIDIDSTLHPYWDQLAAVAQRRFGVSLPYEDQLTWSISRLGPEQLRACVSETHARDLVLAARPYAGAVEVVCRWHRAGHRILIASHRSPEAHDVTRRWLEQIGLPHDELHCSQDKVSHCRGAGVGLLVDDSPPNLLAALDAGIAVATLAHPWNRDVCQKSGVCCAADWPALERAVAPLLGDPGPPAATGVGGARVAAANPRP